MTDFHAQQRLIAALLDPHRFPQGARAVRVIETHISWVLLAGHYAYKIKKAVNLGFLDFTTLELRRFYCSEEMRLNRRLAPQIYLDVIPIGGSHESPLLDVLPAIEYAVRMRRFPANRLLDKLLAKGQLAAQQIDSLAATLVRFHGSLPPAAAGSIFGTPASVRAAAWQNFESLQPLLHGSRDLETLATARRSTETEYAETEKRFNERRMQGRIRECHGDLHFGNVVLIGGEPVPFDGIEFNPDLRWMDVMNEIAFPVMDLLYHDQRALAFRFLNAYLEGGGDYEGMGVLRFYLAYRAMVRAKISAIRARQPDLSRRRQRIETGSCRRHLLLAMQCLTRRRPALIITHGLPGSGKTTFAQTVLEQLGAIRIRSDVERKRLFGLDALNSSRSGANENIYSAEATQRTYARLHELAHAILAAGYTVIVDAAFLKHGERMQFRELAQRMGAPFVIASIRAQDATLRTRLAQRRSLARDASEADAAVLHRLQAAQEPLSAEELDRAIEFTNEEPNGSFPLQPGWNRLQELIAH
jgi:aminoglycoside phosphotransferase family enzyme/predicted kinase